MDNLYYQRADYLVVVKNRAPPPKAWRWEIYRAGNVNPIKQSSVYFDTTAAARRAGKEALNELLNMGGDWGSSPNELAADTAYGTGKFLHWGISAGITP